MSEPAHSQFTSVPVFEMASHKLIFCKTERWKCIKWFSNEKMGKAALRSFVDSLLCLLGGFEKHKYVVCVMQTTSSRWKELLFHHTDMLSSWQFVTCWSQDLTAGIMSRSKSLLVAAFISTHINSQKLRHTLEVTVILQPHQISKEKVWQRECEK